MAAKVKRSHTTLWRYAWLAAVLLPVLAMLYLYYVYPARGIGPQQPIYFSHRVHAGVKQIDCRFCHPFAARSMMPGIPAIQKCFFCHSYLITQHPQIVKEK